MALVGKKLLVEIVGKVVCKDRDVKKCRVIEGGSVWGSLYAKIGTLKSAELWKGVLLGIVRVLLIVGWGSEIER